MSLIIQSQVSRSLETRAVVKYASLWPDLIVIFCIIAIRITTRFSLRVHMQLAKWAPSMHCWHTRNSGDLGLRSRTSIGVVVTTSNMTPSGASLHDRRSVYERRNWHGKSMSSPRNRLFDSLNVMTGLYCVLNIFLQSTLHFKWYKMYYGQRYSIAAL